MKKDIRDYLHLYFKCWGTVTESKSDMYEDGQWALSSGLLEAVMIGAAKFTPHLRTLSSMTEEEKKEFIFICELEPEDVSCVEYNTYFPGNAKSLGTAHLTNVLQWAKGVNYLRKQGIDCDGLIDAGLALEGNTIFFIDDLKELVRQVNEKKLMWSKFCEILNMKVFERYHSTLSPSQEAIEFGQWLADTNWGDTLLKKDPPIIPSMKQLYQLYTKHKNSNQ